MSHGRLVPLLAPGVSGGAAPLAILALVIPLAGCLAPVPPTAPEREVEVPTVPRVPLPPACGTLVLVLEPSTIHDAPAAVEARFGGCDARDLVLGQAACTRLEDHVDLSVEVDAAPWRLTDGPARPFGTVCPEDGARGDPLARNAWVTKRASWNGSIDAGSSPTRVAPGTYVVSAWLVVEGRVFQQKANVTVA